MNTPYAGSDAGCIGETMAFDEGGASHVTALGTFYHWSRRGIPDY